MRMCLLKPLWLAMIILTLKWWCSFCCNELNYFQTMKCISFICSHYSFSRIKKKYTQISKVKVEMIVYIEMFCVWLAIRTVSLCYGESFRSPNPQTLFRVTADQHLCYLIWQNFKEVDSHLYAEQTVCACI